MNRTKIEWTDYTWNPIKGICPVGCWYCYARKMYKRFHLYEGHIERYTPINELVAPMELKKPSKIFVCSTYELFHHSVEKVIRDKIFETIEKCPHHTFQVLTKFPQNIDRAMPDNVWLGVTSTGYPFLNLFDDLYDTQAKIKFISFEPLLSPILLDNWFWNFHFNWIIVGRLTQYGHKYDPKKLWVEKIVEKVKKYNIPIFLKNNLKEIWGEPLIQEFPE